MTNNKYKILVIDEATNSSRQLKTLLEANGYQVICVRVDRNSQLLFVSHHPDLVLLHLDTLNSDSLYLLTEIRKEALTPIVILSAQNSVQTIVEALDAGANDYVTKPFHSAELMARLRAALRNVRYVTDNAMYSGVCFESGDLAIDYDARRVYVCGEEIRLTRTEYNILAFLSEHVGQMMPYASVIKAIWGYSDRHSVKKLQVNMTNIRKKLATDRYILNEPGVGYRMQRVE